MIRHLVKWTGLSLLAMLLPHVTFRMSSQNAHIPSKCQLFPSLVTRDKIYLYRQQPRKGEIDYSMGSNTVPAVIVAQLQKQEGQQKK